MRKEISADPKYEGDGRDAACSVRVVLSLLFCGRSTLRPYMPTCQYANMPTNIPILLLPVVLSPVLTQIVHSAVMR